MVVIAAGSEFEVMNPTQGVTMIMVERDKAAKENFMVAAFVL